MIFKSQKHDYYGTQQNSESHEPSWSVFAQYCQEQDSLILTLLPRSLDDLVQLEKEVPEMFYSDENFELSTELVLEEMISEQKRRRRQESEKSTTSDQGLPSTSDYFKKNNILTPSGEISSAPENWPHFNLVAQIGTYTCIPRHLCVIKSLNFEDSGKILFKIP